jgi:tetratricopeptide (TPR) repeat protein
MTATEKDIQLLIECCICCDYLTEVRETPCCHQLFCHSCIQSWLQTSTKNCPRCRSATLTEETLTKNIVIQRFVDNLQFDCPHKLQGCAAKIPRSDLMKHKRSCPYSPETLTNKHQKKLEELRALLTKYKIGRTRPTDNALYDLAKSFHTERDDQHAKECLQLIKNKKNLPEMVTLQAEIERDDNHYDLALELYTQAYSLANSVPKRIELLLAQGHIYIKKAQYGQAKDTFQQALDLLQTDDQSQIKAEILNAFGLVAKKCSEVKTISFRKFYSFLTFCFYSKYDQAISAYNNALEIVDVDSDLWSDIISNLAGKYYFSSFSLKLFSIFRYSSKER